MNRNTFTFADFDAQKRVEGRPHILKDLDKMLDWGRFRVILAKTDYRNKSNYGMDCYEPEKMLRALIIQKIYNLSDRDLEEQIDLNVMFRWFCKFSSDSPIPVHTTFCRWRQHFIDFEIYESLLDDFNTQLTEKGYAVSQGHMVDATIVKSAARPRKVVIIDTKIENKEMTEAPDSNEQHLNKVNMTVEYSKDTDSNWGYKNGYFYGMKVTAVVDAKGLVKGVVTTPGNRNDGKILPEVLEKVKLPEGTFIGTDKGYDYDENRECLKKHKYRDGIMQKKKINKEEDAISVLRNKSISCVRFVVERTFGTLKRTYGLGRSIYFGLKKTHNYFLLGSLVYNMNRARKLTMDNCPQT